MIVLVPVRGLVLNIGCGGGGGGDGDGGVRWLLLLSLLVYCFIIVVHT